MNHRYTEFETRVYLTERQCLACQRPYAEHLNYKCLFGPGFFTMYYMEFTTGENNHFFLCLGCSGSSTRKTVKTPDMCPLCYARWIFKEVRSPE